MIKVLVAEDHHIVRNGLVSLLQKESDICVIGEAVNGKQVIQKMEEGLQPDIILTDLNMPEIGGLELLTKLQLLPKPPKVLFLSMIDDNNYVVEAIKGGACGYILKNVSESEMFFAIRHIAAGNMYVCSELSINMIKKSFIAPQTFVKARNGSTGPSKREMEVLALIAEGYTNSEIADKLFTSRRTVEGHRQNLIDKTGARNTAALIRYAIVNRIIE